MHSGGGRIFISYRREDIAHVAGRLADRLIEGFGIDRVFIDVDSLQPGVDFAEAIEGAVGSSQVLLAVIGSQWTDVKDQGEGRRLDDPDDFVVLEIQAALARDVPVIPVLVDEARMPRREHLPQALEGLSQRHAIRVHHESFRRDSDRLMEAIRGADASDLNDIGVIGEAVQESTVAIPDHSVKHPSRKHLSLRCNRRHRASHRLECNCSSRRPTSRSADNQC